MPLMRCVSFARDVTALMHRLAKLEKCFLTANLVKQRLVVDLTVQSPSAFHALHAVEMTYT